MLVVKNYSMSQAVCNGTLLSKQLTDSNYCTFLIIIVLMNPISIKKKIAGESSEDDAIKR